MLVAVGLLVALAAAARSTWSPCGLSVMSSITPFAERARGHRYWATAAWFVAGAVLGGLTLGGAAALWWWAGPVHGGALRVAWVVAGAAAAAGALVDAGIFGPVLPVVRRQVDDSWLARYRPWVYGGGFGWQLGVGVVTYLMTSGVIVVLLLAALAGVQQGSPTPALMVGGFFGLARGLTVFVTAHATSPSRLRDLHRRIEASGGTVRRCVVGVLSAAGLGLAAAALLDVPVGVVCIAVVAVGLVPVCRSQARAGSSGARAG